MRKFFGFFLSLLLLAGLAGCAPGAQTPSAEEVAAQLSQPWTGKAALDGDDFDAVVAIERPSPAETLIRVEQPATLAGLTFHFTPEGREVTFGGMAFSAPDGELKMALPTLAAEVLDEITRPADLTVERDEEDLLLTGQTENGKFEVKLDPVTFAIRELDIPSRDLSLDFSEFAYAEAAASSLPLPSGSGTAV